MVHPRLAGGERRVAERLEGAACGNEESYECSEVEAADAPAASSDANVQALERELRATKTQLQAAVDELETRIEDMKSTTEEFQAVNEELQSSNEELETSKEEMQSVNEELQTINNELSDKQELLTRANTDLQNLLDSTQIPTVFLDDELRIRHFTPALTQLFPVRDAVSSTSVPPTVPPKKNVRKFNFLWRQWRSLRECPGPDESES